MAFERSDGDQNIEPADEILIEAPWENFTIMKKKLLVMPVAVVYRNSMMRRWAEKTRITIGL